MVAHVLLRPPKTVVARVLLSYAVLALAFALVAGWSVVAQRNAAREAEQMRSAYLPLALALRDAVASQDTFNSQLNHITTAQNPADKRVWFDTTLSLGRPVVFGNLRATLTRAFMEGDRELLPVGRELLELAAHIEQFLEGDRELLSKLFNALARGDRAEAENLRDTLVTRGLSSHRSLRELEQKVDRNLDALLAGAKTRERRALEVLIGSALLTVLIGIAVALYVKRVLLPLGLVTGRARAVAQGDLAPREAIGTSDELGELSQTFESMVQAIARANSELLAAERLATIGKMAAQVTHEVRNPLSSLALNVEMLEEEIGDNPEAHVLLGAIKGEIDRLTELSERYLSVARRSKPNFQDEDMAELVHDALASVKPELNKHGITALVSVPEASVILCVDEGQIRQVLINLLRNARQALAPGGTIKVLLEKVEPSAVQILIDDNGPGIDREAREHLFEPFFTTKRHGTGLGLAIAREIIEAHSGTLECQPLNPGTRFVISLPAGKRGDPAVQALGGTEQLVE